MLADRCWPGTRRAQVDLIVIGPGGVFIVDTKAWAEVTIDRGRVHRGDADVTDELLGLADLADLTQADLAEVGLAPGEVRPLIALAGRRDIDATVNGVRIVGERDLLAASPVTATGSPPLRSTSSWLGHSLSSARPAPRLRWSRPCPNRFCRCRTAKPSRTRC